jgi:hypothetical protein
MAVGAMQPIGPRSNAGLVLSLPAYPLTHGGHLPSQSVARRCSERVGRSPLYWTSVRERTPGFDHAALCSFVARKQFETTKQNFLIHRRLFPDVARRTLHFFKRSTRSFIAIVTQRTDSGCMHRSPPENAGSASSYFAASTDGDKLQWSATATSSGVIYWRYSSSLRLLLTPTSMLAQVASSCRSRFLACSGYSFGSNHTGHV